MAKLGRIDEEVRDRATELGAAVVSLADELPGDATSRHLGHQVMRAGTSVGAHVREASRARSDKEFISKLDVAIQEADETPYWLELLANNDRATKARLRVLYKQADDLIGILTTTVIDTKDQL